MSPSKSKSKDTQFKLDLSADPIKVAAAAVNKLATSAQQEVESNATLALVKAMRSAAQGSAAIVSVMGLAMNDESQLGKTPEELDKMVLGKLEEAKRHVIDSIKYGKVASQLLSSDTSAMGKYAKLVAEATPMAALMTFAVVGDIVNVTPAEEKLLSDAVDRMEGVMTGMTEMAMGAMADPQSIKVSAWLDAFGKAAVSDLVVSAQNDILKGLAGLMRGGDEQGA